jgi:hypothetical protein
MRQNGRCEQRFHELICTDLPADDLERLAPVDALLRGAAARDREEAASLPPRARFSECPSSGAFKADAERAMTATNGSTWPGLDHQTHELKLTFGQRALVYKSLQAVKTLGALSPQDELLNDTIQLVDLAMTEAV